MDESNASLFWKENMQMLLQRGKNLLLAVFMLHQQTRVL
jgi:hypothetical protein